MYYNENGSRTALKAAAAAFVMAVPAVMIQMSTSAGLYFAAALLMALVLWRNRESGKIYLSVVQLPILALVFYALVSSFFAKNYEGHLIYIVLLFTGEMFAAAAVDYFSVSREEQMQRRMLYMIAISGSICGIWNIIYHIVFRGGTERSDALGFMMFAAIWCCETVAADCIKSRRILLHTGSAIMAVVLVMSRSAASVVFAVIFSSVYFLRKRIEKRSRAEAAMTVAAAICTGLLTSYFSSGGIAPLCDSIITGLKNPAGIGGGGFLSGQQMYASQNYVGVKAVGALGAAASASGIFGLLICIAVVVWTVVLYIRKQNGLSLFAMFMTVCFMSSTFAENYASLLLWMGVLVYNDTEAGMTHIASYREKHMTEKLCAVGVVIVLLMTMGVLTLLRGYGKSLYSEGRYEQAEQILKAVSRVNITDSESLVLLAECKMQQGSDMWEEACSYIDKAKNRCKNSAGLSAKEGDILYRGGQYIRSAQQWEAAMSMAPFNQQYRICSAKALYKALKEEKRGSAEAKRIYDSIVLTAQGAGDLETKKIIGDIADKALEYTRDRKLVSEEEPNEGSAAEG